MALRGRVVTIYDPGGVYTTLGGKGLMNPFPAPGISPPHALLARDRPAAPQAAPVVAR